MVCGYARSLDIGGGSGLSEVDAASRRAPPFARSARRRTRCHSSACVHCGPGIPSPCATMAPLLRFAPPGCNALHVEGIPSLRGGLGRSAPAGRRMRSRAKPASTAGLRLGGSWARSSGGMSDDAGCELPRLASAIGGAQNGTQGRSRAGHPPLSSASVELRRLALDPRACNTGVYNPRELLNWGSID